MNSNSAQKSDSTSHMSTSRSVTTATAATVVAIVTTTIFSIGYMTAVYYTRKKILQEIYNSTAGCIIMEDATTQNTTDHDRRNATATIPAPRRFGACIQLKPDKYIEYRTLHDAVWDQVQQRIYNSHIRNFTIYYHAETSTLYQHFEWIGHWYALQLDDTTTTTKEYYLSVEEEQALLDADFYAITQDPITREWWKLCEPCQQPFKQWYNQQQEISSPSEERLLLLPSEGNTTGDWWAPMECVCHTGHYPIAFSLQTYDPDFVKLKKS